MDHQMVYRLSKNPHENGESTTPDANKMVLVFIKTDKYLGDLIGVLM